MSPDERTSELDVEERAPTGGGEPEDTRLGASGSGETLSMASSLAPFCTVFGDGRVIEESGSIGLTTPCIMAAPLSATNSASCSQGSTSGSTVADCRHRRTNTHTNSLGRADRFVGLLLSYLGGAEESLRPY